MEILDEKNETFFESLIQCAVVVQVTKKVSDNQTLAKNCRKSF